MRQPVALPNPHHPHYPHRRGAKLGDGSPACRMDPRRCDRLTSAAPPSASSLSPPCPRTRRASASLLRQPRASGARLPRAFGEGGVTIYGAARLTDRGTSSPCTRAGFDNPLFRARPRNALGNGRHYLVRPLQACCRSCRSRVASGDRRWMLAIRARGPVVPGAALGPRGSERSSLTRGTRRFLDEPHRADHEVPRRVRRQS